MNIRTFCKAACVLMLAGSVSACASSFFGSKDETPTVETKPPDVLYKEASEKLDKSDYTEAAKRFEEVDRQHPYSNEARQAVLMAAFAYEKAGKGPEAVEAARRYLALHPGTKEAALAQNIIATAYYNRINDA